jgi:glutamine amidotransferase
MKPVLIVDYGLGNLSSVVRAVRHLGAEAVLSSDPSELLAADRLILPGVGAFPVAMKNLNRLGLAAPLKEFAASRRPLLGICLGMQLFMDESDEGGVNSGLGLIPGRVARLRESPDSSIKVPHIGWSNIDLVQRNWQSTILNEIEPGDSLYFVHSYYVEPVHGADILATTDYGTSRYCSVIARENVIGCQAHPEKSGETGLQLIRNFLDIY